MNARDPHDNKSPDDERSVSELTVDGLGDTSPAPTVDVTIELVDDSSGKSPSFVPLTGENAATLAIETHDGGETASFSVDDTGTLVYSDPSSTQAYQGSSTSPKVVIPGYKILGELGRGAMGVVYKAHQERADRMVALKVMLNLDHAREAEVARFKVEAQAAARLEHPNIIHVFDVGQAGELPYFTLEFVDGGTLAGKISKQMLTIDESAKMMHTLATAIAYAHGREVIHRDLKPANILLTQDGNPKIADFGLARRTDDVSHLTIDGTILGTPNYMSPEQAAGDQEVIGPLSDVYTLGAIFYELLVGRPPFKAATGWEVIQQVRSAEPTPPTTLQPGIPRDLETICLKCLQKAPEKRYGSAQLLAEDLQRFLNNEPILARPIGQVERIVRLCRRYPREARLLGLIATLLIVMTGGAIATAYRINSDRERITQQVDQISKQRDEITVEKQLSDDRLTTYRQTVSKLVNNVPNLLEGAPLGSGTRQDFLSLMGQILDGTEDTGAVGPSRQWGLEAVALREGESLLQQAASDSKRSDRAQNAEELLNLAQEKFREAEKIAQEVLDGKPQNMAKATSNLAHAVARLANTAAIRKAPIKEVAALNLRAIELRREALAQETDEKAVVQRKAELGSVLDRYALYLLGVETNDPIRFATRAMEYVQEAIPNLESAVNELPPGENIAIDARRDLATAYLTMALAASKLGQHEHAEKAFAQSVEAMRKLADDFPNRFLFRKKALEAANLYGDYLLEQKKDPAAIRKIYENGMEDLKDVLDTSEIRELHFGYHGLAMQNYRLGIVELQAGNSSKAKAFFERSALLREMVWRDALEKLADDKDDKQLDRVITQRIELMLVQARSGTTTSALQHAKWIRDRAESLWRDEENERKARETSADASKAGELTAGGFKANQLFLQAAATYALVSEHMVASESPKAINAALKAVKRSIETGYQDANYLLHDADLLPLQKLDEYPKLIATIKSQ